MNCHCPWNSADVLRWVILVNFTKLLIAHVAEKSRVLWLRLEFVFVGFDIGLVQSTIIVIVNFAIAMNAVLVNYMFIHFATQHTNKVLK